MMPKVSVVMPVYNASRFLREAVDSVFAQTLTDWELVAVDDGSTDDSLAILREYERRDGRVRVISRPNTGIVGARNDGINASRARFIAMMDADDVSLAARFQRQVEWLETHEDCVAVGTLVDLIDEWGDRFSRRPAVIDHSRIVAGLVRGDGAVLCQPSVMMRRATVQSLGGYDHRYLYADDVQLFLRLSKKGTLANIDDYLFNYRFHSKSVSRTKRLQQQEEVIRAVTEVLGPEHVVQRSDREGSEGSVTEDARLFAGWMALQSGYVATARKYGLRMVTAKPLHLSSWKLLACALRGR